jgi:uncharacterized protein (DUF302 family)
MDSDSGLTTRRSTHSVRDTIDRLAAAVTAKGLTVFARIDHAAGATTAGLALRPTELLIFGQARGGTALMQDRQTAGIDLPLKALAWQDAEGAVWLTVNDPAWIGRRHDLGDSSAAAVQALSAGLAAFVTTATEG